MDDHTALAELEELARRLEIQIRYERLAESDAVKTGGLCRIRGQLVLIVNSRIPMHAKVQVLSEFIGRFDLNDLYLKPALRKLLHKEEPAEN
ncbi:MAG: hypothetical protein PHY31_09785 [Smithellaceae bacterium]|nr:hypothetical protein [Smithellaceae bacterium]